jgi:hypothetical protein
MAASTPAGYEAASVIPSKSGEAEESAGDARAAPVASPSEQVQAVPKTERPGLATHFGEDIESRVRHATFERATPTSPFVTATIWYNDSTGASAMASHSGTHEYGIAETALFDGGLVIRVLDEQRHVLRGLTADNRSIAIGEAGSRYLLGIQNKSDYTFEVVASVDGLGVIDGRPAAYDRPGYILYAHQSIAIEGFRTSEQSVAAFRFGNVSQSYSVEMGHGDRNVGVMGFAFFHEQGKNPVYVTEDTRQRLNADPFPGQYAPRPLGK